VVGYSGTPLSAKIGIRDGDAVLTVNAPGDFKRWLEPLPAEARLSSRIRKADVVVMFCRSDAELRRVLPRAMRAIGPAGMIWVAWPKKASGITSDLQTRHVMMSTMLPTGLVDVKVGAISEVWSGLKFVVRKKQRHTWSEPGAPL